MKTLTLNVLYEAVLPTVEGNKLINVIRDGIHTVTGITPDGTVVIVPRSALVAVGS